MEGKKKQISQNLDSFSKDDEERVKKRKKIPKEKKSISIKSHRMDKPRI